MVVFSGQAQIAVSQAEVRRRINAELAASGVKPSVCVDCGGAFYKQRRQAPPYCPECGLHRGIDGNEQMARREGPVYEKAVRGQLRYWLGEAARLGIDFGE